MNNAATTTPDPNISTRSVDEVRLHRNSRVANMLREYAARLEMDDVHSVRAEATRGTIILPNRDLEADTQRRAQQYGGTDDLTLTISVTLIAPDDAECPEDNAGTGDCGRAGCPYCTPRAVAS